MSRGYSKADPIYTNGYTVWLHPVTNDVLNQYGQKVPLQTVPQQKHHKTRAAYLKLSCRYGNMLLARLKYITFKEEIKPGEEVDHIDGNSLNNNIRNLRAVSSAINRRDGGFLRKLRNKSIRPDYFSGVLLVFFDRMAEYKTTHTKTQYERLTREDLMRMLVVPKFTIVRPGIIDDFPKL